MIDCRRWQPIWFTQKHGLLPETRCASLPQAQDVAWRMPRRFGRGSTRAADDRDPVLPHISPQLDFSIGETRWPNRQTIAESGQSSGVKPGL
jgi:hypothetical protein